MIICIFCVFMIGWMYESRGGGNKVSLQTKLWGLGVKLLSSKSKPLLYSYQGSLPKLPLPSVSETMKRVIIFFMLNFLFILTISINFVYYYSI